MTLPPNFLELPAACRLKVVLNDSNHVKVSSQFITNSFNIRSKILK